MIRTLPAGYNAGDTIYCYFGAYTIAGGASVTITGLATTDIEVYKNGSTTQRASDNGYTLLDTDGIDFDSSTGLHGFSIDTSDNSDSGFWADGSHYLIWVDAVTIDGSTVRLGFETRLGVVLAPTTAGRKLDVSPGGEAGIDWANVGSPTTTINLSGTTIKTATDVETDTADIQSKIGTPAGASVSADIAEVKSETATIVADTNELQGDWANGGRLDLILDARASQTSVDDLPTNSELATALAAADDAVLAAIAALNNLSAAQVNAEVDSAIETYHLDHLFATTYDPASKPGAADALLNELVENDGGVSRFTANSLEEAPTGGSAPTVGEIADAVWDEATSGHTTGGTFGEQAKTDIDSILTYALAARNNTAYAEGGWTWVSSSTANVGSASGTTEYENGTHGNPCKSWADAYTISLARAIRRIKVQESIFNSSPVASANQEMNVGQALSNYIVDFNGSGWEFPNAMSGTNRCQFWNGRIYAKDAETLTFDNDTGGVDFINMVVGHAIAWDCRFSTTLNTRIALSWTFLSSAAALSHRFINCQAQNSSTPIIFDMGGQDGNVQWINWDGDIDLRNATDASLTMDIHGRGRLIIKDSCTAGTIRVNGMALEDESGNPWQNASGKPTVIYETEALAMPERQGLTLIRTTIATLASQTSFTLTAGSADDNAYNNCMVVVSDATTGVQKAYGLVKDYTGSTKTVTLLADPGVFTMAATDTVQIVPVNPLLTYVAASAAGRVSGAGTSTEVFKDLDEATTRLTVTADEDGNRTDVAYS